MLNVRAILLLWLLVLMSGAALLNASTATAEANEGKHTTILTMRKRSDRVELEMVPVEPPTLEDVASSPEYIERVKRARNGELPMYTPEGSDLGELHKKFLGNLNHDAARLVDGEEKILPDFYYRQRYEDGIARGFAALSIGWNNENAEDNKQLRQDAVNAFGEGWVADWEKQSPVTQMEIAGKRFLTEYYTMQGDKGHEAITRYNDATKEDRKKDGALIALDECHVWQNLQKKGKEWYAGEAAKRKAEARAREEEAERLDALLYDVTIGKKNELTAEEFKLLKDSGIPFDSLNRARDAFSLATQRGVGIRSLASGVIGNDETARQILLGAIRKKAGEDEAWWEFENGALNTVTSGVAKPISRLTGSVLANVGGLPIQLWHQFFWNPGARLSPNGLVPRDEGERKNLLTLAYGDAMTRNSLSLLGDIDNAVQSGREDHRKGTGFRVSHFVEGTVDTAALVASWLIPVLRPAAVAETLISQSTGAASRGRGVPMSDEEFQQIAKEKGLEEAYRQSGIQERSSSTAAILGQTVLASGVEIASFMVVPKLVGGGVARLLGTSHATTKAGKWLAGKAGSALGVTAAGRGVMAARTATGNALTRFGSTEIGTMTRTIGRTTIDFGAVIPLASGLMRTAVDAAIDDPKLARGMEDLAATWQELFKPEYWGEMLASGVLFVAALVGAARLRARREIDKLGRVYGLTDEQRREVKNEKRGNRIKKLEELNEYNWKNDWAATQVRASKASRKWNYEQWAAALAVVLLVLAVADSANFPRWLDLPYGFYLLLRVIVAVLSAWQAARALMEKRHPLLFLLPACLCLIYQPLVKIPFKRETWLWLNAASVFVLIIGARRKKDNVGNDA